MTEPTPEELAAVRDDNSYEADKPAKAVAKRHTDPIRRQRSGVYAPDSHRLLPSDEAVEKGVLSAFLLAPTEVGEMIALRKIQSGFFHIPAHQTIFSGLLQLEDEGKPLDFISITSWLRDRGRLDEVGGAPAVSALFTYLPTAANAEYYLSLLVQLHTLREIIRVGTDYAARSYEERDEWMGLLDSFERDALAIRESTEVQAIIPIRDTVMETLNDLQRMIDNKGKITGIETGFPELDYLTNGLEMGLYVIAARPSVGKTAFALNLIDHICINLGLPVGIITCEMSRKQIVQRWICQRARVNVRNLCNGIIAERDFPAISKAAVLLQSSAAQIDDGSDVTIQQVRGRARRWKRERGMRVLFVDYLQLLKSDSKRGRNDRQLEVAEVSAGLKSIAKELDIPVVALAQINRGFEARGPLARPRLSDLKESGAIEQDADFVGFLNRPEMSAEDADEREQRAGQAELIVAKQRSGPIGEVPLTFLKEFAHFESRAWSADECAVADEEARRQGTMPL